MELDEHSGAALRGNLFESIWQRFCTNKSAFTCADCALNKLCPVSSLVAPLREENPRGRDIPRPYIFLPPLAGARTYQTGETMTFGLTLFGNIIELLPYILLSMPTMQKGGLGRRVQDGQRGTFRVQRIESYHPFTREKCEIFRNGEILVQKPTFSIGVADILARAAQLPQEQLTLEFLTPTRIIEMEKLQRWISFRTLILRLQERLTNLRQHYGEPSLTDEPLLTTKDDLIACAKQIHYSEDQTTWQEVKSYSRRQKRTTPVSGVTGRITYTGDLAAFRELLVWGELIHVGKSVVKGNGWYRIVTDEAISGYETP